MNELHLSAMPRLGNGQVRRDIRSSAGDGFKAVFHNIIQSGSSQRSPNPADSLQAVAAPEQGEGGPSAPEDAFSKEVLEKISEKLSDNSLEDLDPDLKATLDKLINSADKLGDKDVDNLVKEIKSLLKDPDTASQVLAVLEKAGVDLSTFNMHDLRVALKSLPAEVRQELVTLLSGDTKATLTTENVSKALSEALGQLLQEQKKPDKEGQVAATTASNADADGETFDQFLRRSRARVLPILEEAGIDTSKLSLRKAFAAANKLAEGQATTVTADTTTAESPQSPPPSTSPAEALTSAVLAEVKGMQVADVAQANNASNSKGSVDGATAVDQAKLNKMKNTLADVQVPRTHRGTDIEKSNMLKRLMAQARLHLNQAGEGKFQIRLDPPELGHLKLTIENKEGVLAASITTETEAARQTLLGSLDQLKVALAEQGINVGDLNVSTNPDSGRNQGQFERQLQEHQNRMMVAAERRRDGVQEDDEIEVDESDLTILNVEV